MKYTVSRTEILGLLQKAGNFTSYRLGDIESLRGVYIEVSKDGMRAHATNLMDYFCGSVGGKVMEEGVCLVEHKALIEVIKTLNDPKIDIEKNTDSTLLLTTTAGRLTLPLLDPTTFPLSVAPETAETEEVNIEDLFPQGVALALQTAATDEARPILTGVCYDFNAGKQIVASTDGFRLTVITNKHTKSQRVGRLIIPSRSLSVVGNVFKNEIKKAGIAKDKKRIFFYGDGFLLTTRTLEGEYPPYEKVIPGSGETHITVNKHELQQALKTASLFSREGSHVVLFKIEGEGLTISSPRSSVGEATLSIPLVKKEGVDNTTTFNYKYISSFISEADGETIDIEMTEANLPSVFRDPKNENTIHIIMPIRSQE